MKPTVPLTRSIMLNHFANHFRAMGAPVEALLKEAGIDPDTLYDPGALVSLYNAYDFCELACRTLDCEHAGLYVGLARSLDDLGSYGSNLKKCRTISDYLTRGIALFNTLTTGEQFWLSYHGSEIRFNVTSPGASGLGMYQSHLSIIAITIASFRERAGADWYPREVGFAYTSTEPIPAVGLFEESEVLKGSEHSYFTFPRSLLDTKLPSAGVDSDSGGPSPGDALPENIINIVLNQLEAFPFGSHKLHIDTIAKSLSMSRRRLQRALANQGVTYFQLLKESRLRRAKHWLEHSDKAVTEIALALGYSDASNFSRAFRQQTDLSPVDFRNKCKST